MTNIKLLQIILDYIEENLKTELSLEELANLAGFSSYHFCHLFSDFVGIPVAAYITKRRIHHAIYEISQSNKMIDTIFLYGFDTHAGFYKAFKREFGCSPSKFLKLTTVRKPKTINLFEEAKIMLTNTQIKALLSNWEIDSKLKIEPTLEVGGTIQSKDTWTIGNTFIFKTGKNIAGLRSHIAISRALAKTGMTAACPVLTKTGEDFIIVDDRFYVVTQKISGEFLLPQERYNTNRYAIAMQYGEAIGKLHAALLSQDASLEVNDTNMLEVVLNWAMPHTQTVMEQWGCPLPDAFYSDYKENFPKLYDKLPRQVIHRDANPSKIMFHEGEVSGFIDFIISERNVRLFDPCYCATGILSESGEIEAGFDKWPEILRGILQGYDHITPLTSAEKQAIPYVIYSIQMIFIAWLIDHEAYKDCALQNRKMLVWMWENKEACFNF
ncbi:MAG: helix-turn-helix domain-containing protein [Cellulosilyticaceae bacterium]